MHALWVSEQGTVAVISLTSDLWDSTTHKLLYYWFRNLADLGEGKALSVSTAEKLFKEFLLGLCT